MPERWTWTVYPGLMGAEIPTLVCGGVSGSRDKAVGYVEYALIHDLDTFFGEVAGPGGKIIVARRGKKPGQVAWRDRWPVNGDTV